MRTLKCAVPSNDNLLRAELDMSPMCAGRLTHFTMTKYGMQITNIASF